MARIGFGIDTRHAGAGGTALQVAALPYRRNEGSLQFLLVTSRTSRRWIIPKGWPVKGLSLAESAAREAYEEAGVRGEVGPAEIGRFVVEKSQRGVASNRPVAVFPLAVGKTLHRWPEQAQRERAWLAPADAAARIDVPAVRTLLLEFDPARYRSSP